MKDGDVGMVQGAYGSGLALESDADVFAACDVFGKNLESHCSLEASVAGFIHFAHTACTDVPEDFVRPEFFTDAECHRSGPPLSQSSEFYSITSLCGYNERLMRSVVIAAFAAAALAVAQAPP